MRLGIFGGSFDPVHHGHLVLAETAREALGLDRVLFIPTGQAPHKADRAQLDGRQRLALVRLAVRGHPGFSASDIELARPGASYTLDTVRLLRTRYPRASLFLLIGDDMLAVRWRGWEELRRLCTVAAARRDAPGRGARRPSGVRWLDMPRIGISSSLVRARVRAGRSIRYLVPAGVERVIRRRRFYRSRGT
ncbi:MAG TPA: nicotinate-nucleotide adenylyltransferase [bacterium]